MPLRPTPPDSAVEARIRNLQIRDLNEKKEPAFQPLFNGKDLQGWEGDTKAWSVEKGELAGQHGFIHPQQSFDNYELSVQFRVSPTQSIKPPPQPSTLWLELDDLGKKAPTAGIGITLLAQGGLTLTPGGGFKLRDYDENPLAKPIRIVEWNDLRIMREDGRIHLYVATIGAPKAGFIGLQTAFDTLHVRNIAIRNLSPQTARDGDDLAKLKGQWLASQGELRDKPLPAKDYEKLEIRFGSSDFEILKPGQKPDRLTGIFKVEAAQKRIMLQFKDGTRGVPCSYRLEGDRMRLDFEGLLALDTIVGKIGDRLHDADLSHSKNNLRQIALAMHCYHDKYKGLPRAALTNIQAKDGKPLLSWRVALLPWLEQNDLYKAFKLDEPWDSPHNKKLISKMPPIFAAPGIKTKEAGLTHYQVFVGRGTAFEPIKDRPHGVRFAEITDGLSFTLLVVEAAEPVFWTKPDDLPIDPKKPLPKLGMYAEGIHAAFCDGAVGMLPTDIADKTLRALITRNGGETVMPPLLTPQGTRLRLDFRRPTEAEKLQGNWRLILGDLDSKLMPADKLPDMEIRLHNGEIEVVVPGQKPIQGTYEFDAQKKQIRIRLKDVKAVDTWSYHWEGERLAIETKGLPLTGGPRTPPIVRLTFERSR